jgi:hypothetical protein
MDPLPLRTAGQEGGVCRARSCAEAGAGELLGVLGSVPVMTIYSGDEAYGDEITSGCKWPVDQWCEYDHWHSCRGCDESVGCYEGADENGPGAQYCDWDGYCDDCDNEIKREEDAG